MATAASSSPKIESLRRFFRDALRIVFPELCCHCGKILVGDEQDLCTDCLCQIPWARLAEMPDNAVEQRLSGYHVQAAASLLIFRKGNIGQTIIHQIKYHGNLRLAHTYGRLLGNELKQSGRFNDIDGIVPVPLHFLRRIKRGYNQSEQIAQAVAEVLQCPVLTCNLYRKRYTATQTHKNRTERHKNMQNVFAVRHPEQLSGKHILLLDDVITTGATTTSCFLALSQIPDLRVSIASLAVTQ